MALFLDHLLRTVPRTSLYILIYIYRYIQEAAAGRNKNTEPTGVGHWSIFFNHHYHINNINIYFDDDYISIFVCALSDVDRG